MPAKRKNKTIYPIAARGKRAAFFRKSAIFFDLGLHTRKNCVKII